MANALYNLGRQAFLEGNIAWLSDKISVILVTNSYTPNLYTHQFLSDIGANTVGTAQILSNKTSTFGVANATDIVFGAVAGGSTVNYILIYKDTGDSNSLLIAIIDTGNNLPITTNGGDVDVNWDNGINKIFKL